MSMHKSKVCIKLMDSNLSHTLSYILLVMWRLCSLATNPECLSVLSCPGVDEQQHAGISHYIRFPH